MAKRKRKKRYNITLVIKHRLRRKRLRTILQVSFKAFRSRVAFDSPDISLSKIIFICFFKNYFSFGICKNKYLKRFLILVSNV